jgi:Family of unknown function (DUF6263)
MIGAAGVSFHKLAEERTMKTAATLAPRCAFGAFALTLAVVSFSTSMAARADETLRWKFTKGQTVNYVFNQQTVTQSEVNGQKIDVTMTQAMELNWKIKDVASDGTASMDQTIDRILYTMKGGPTGEITIDTSKDEKQEGPLAALVPLFKALTGTPFSLKMNTRGEVSDVQVPEKVVEALKNTGPLAQAGGEMFTEKGLKELTSQATIVLPKESVAKGFKWNSTKTINLPFGSMNLDSAYTYEGPSDALEKIGVDVKMDIKPAANSPFEINIAKQDNKGAFLFDNKNGVLSSSEVGQKIQMKIKVMNQEIVQNIETNVKMGQAKPAATK